MYIPNVRQSIDNFFGKKKMNYYYEGNLNSLDKQVVYGYDWCFEDVKNAIYNTLEERLNGILGFNEEMLNGVINDITEDILFNLESSRNEVVVSLIENDDSPQMEKRLKEMEDDFKNLTEEEFLKKYPTRVDEEE